MAAVRARVDEGLTRAALRDRSVVVRKPEMAMMTEP